VLKNDMMSIWVDDNTIEPPEMFKERLPPKYVDDAPRPVHEAEGSDTWHFSRHRDSQWNCRAWMRFGRVVTSTRVSAGCGSVSQ
jgi:hypothetical protein